MNELTAAADDPWVPACGGTETPTKTRTGRTLLYLWNTTTGEHAHFDCDRDLFLTQQQASEAFALD